MRIGLRFLAAVVLGMFFVVPARATWSPAGNPVCTAPGFQGELFALPVSGADLSGSHAMFVTWSDARDSIPSVTDIYFNDVSSYGDVGSANGSPVVVAPGFQGSPCAAVCGPGPLQHSDAVAVAWTDNRNGALDIFANQFGGFGWPGGVVSVCTAPGVQFQVQICDDDYNGVILAWVDERDGFDAVYAQRLDSNGVPLWTANGIAVCTVPATRSGLRLLSHSGGGAYVAWTDDRSGPPRTYAVLLDNATGSPAAGWPANGVQVTDLASTTLDRLVGDAAGGIYLTLWSTAGNPVAQRLDAGGGVHPGWSASGVALRQGAVGGSLQDAVPYGGGLVAVWVEDVDPDKTIALDLRAQRLLGDGSRAAGWGPDGNVVCDAPGDQVNARLADGPYLVAVWEDGRSLADGTDVYALRLDENGTRAAEWPVNGVKVAGGNGRQTSPRPVSDGLSGTMIAYVDDHDFNSFETDVYAQIVSFGGKVDVPRPIARGHGLSAPVPNPARVEVSFALAWPEGAQAQVGVLDALGRRVRSLPAATGGSRIRWDLCDTAGRAVEPGVYFVRVEGGGRTFSRPVIVRR